jgi:decaprenylphospho-beta-D-ribofuranose 2-oxidase
MATPLAPVRQAERRLLTGWGRTAPTLAYVEQPADAEEVGRLLAAAGGRGAIARGLGRAYGDAAQNAGGLVMDMTAFDSIGQVAADGSVRVGAGVSIDALVSKLLPEGWFPAVTPGTSQVTIGGAIAADVHGKNHHRDGSFCRHVREIELWSPAGGLRMLRPEQSPDEFWATAGGMGLTGVIVGATLALRRVETAQVRVDTERTADLDDVLDRMTRGDAGYQYSVAWIDCLARGRQLGRSILLRGDHATPEELPLVQRADPLRPVKRISLRAPAWAPGGLLRPSTVRAFNTLWFHRAREAHGALEPIGPYFYPLDAVEGWNRLYGPRGLVQYQCVLPFGAEPSLRATLELLSGRGCPAFLAVLKRFGEQDEGLLSFPTAGWTLALDVPADAPALAPLLDELDLLVTEAGGRVYLAKDSRMMPELLERMYPRLNSWREVREGLDPDRRLRSDLARRLELA